jgi:alpha-2-macroglobulin-like protein
LERLIQEPSGCFEQTSSTCYPLVMAQQYFLTHTGIDPKLVEQSRKHLDSGYAKLAGYECKAKGYEWFGSDPGHEALTAYGLLEFTDMAQVRPVDPEMLKRTRAWLLARRDGKGGFQRTEKAADSFGRAPPGTTDAYVTWALLESGEQGLEKEVARVKELGQKSDDSYIVALAANVAYLSGDRDTAKKLSDKLLKKQSASGAVDGGATTITCSGGESLAMETTALTLLAWMRDPAYAGAVEKSMNWLAESCKAGRFGSTQSTILCLRAIVTYDKSRATPKASGTTQVFVDGHAMGSPVAFSPETKGAIPLADVSEMMSPGRHTVELRMTDGSAMPCAVAVNYYTTQPDSAKDCKLRIETALRNAEMEEGGVTEAAVKVTNLADEVLPTPVAIVGVPGGLEVRHDQLKELVKSGKVDAYEVTGREVVLYWRGLKPRQQVELPISLVAAVPGAYTAPASRAYLYYTDEFKHWASGMRATITPKAEAVGVADR